MKIYNSLLIIVFWICTCHRDVHADTDEWLKLTSDNFEFFAQYDEQTAMEKLHEFEAFRFAVHSLLGMDPARKLSPVRIFAFSDNNDYQEIVGPDNIAGFYSENGSGHYMVIGPEALGINDNSTLFHEYLHYIVRAGTPYHYPTWYDEGLAGFFGAVEITDEYLIFGSRPDEYLQYLKVNRGLSFEKILHQTNRSKSENKTREYQWKFYATSWLAVHFLMQDAFNGERVYQEPLQKYLLLHNQGLTPNDAFVRSFEMETNEFNKKLKSHVKKRRNTAFKMPRPALDLRVTLDKISEADAALFYSQLTWMRRPEVSDKYFQRALAENQSLAMAYQANRLVKNGEVEEAQSLIEKALKSESKTAETQLHVAKAYLAIAARTGNRRLYPKALAQLLLAEKNWPAAPLYRTLATTYLKLGLAQKYIDYSIAQYELAPSSILANRFAAESFIEVKQWHHARVLVNNVSHWSHSEGMSRWASEKLMQISTLEQESMK